MLSPTGKQATCSRERRCLSIHTLRESPCGYKKAIYFGLLGHLQELHETTAFFGECFMKELGKRPDEGVLKTGFKQLTMKEKERGYIDR